MKTHALNEAARNPERAVSLALAFCAGFIIAILTCGA